MKSRRSGSRTLRLSACLLFGSSRAGFSSVVGSGLPSPPIRSLSHSVCFARGLVPPLPPVVRPRIESDTETLVGRGDVVARRFKTEVMQETFVCFVVPAPGLPRQHVEVVGLGGTRLVLCGDVPPPPREQGTKRPAQWTVQVPPLALVELLPLATPNLGAEAFLSLGHTAHLGGHPKGHGLRLGGGVFGGRVRSRETVPAPRPWGPRPRRSPPGRSRARPRGHRLG